MHSLPPLALLSQSQFSHSLLLKLLDCESHYPMLNARTKCLTTMTKLEDMIVIFPQETVEASANTTDNNPVQQDSAASVGSNFESLTSATERKVKQKQRERKGCGTSILPKAYP
ncbi:hypothetical protein STEG23_022941 [Scotinomys teguina]